MPDSIQQQTEAQHYVIPKQQSNVKSLVMAVLLHVGIGATLWLGASSEDIHTSPAVKTSVEPQASKSVESPQLKTLAGLGSNEAQKSTPSSVSAPLSGMPNVVQQGHPESPNRMARAIDPARKEVEGKRTASASNSDSAANHDKKLAKKQEGRYAKSRSSGKSVSMLAQQRKAAQPPRKVVAKANIRKVDRPSTANASNGRRASSEIAGKKQIEQLRTQEMRRIQMNSTAASVLHRR